MNQRKLDILKLSTLCLTGLVLLMSIGLGGTYLIGKIYQHYYQPVNYEADEVRTWEA